MIFPGRKPLLEGISTQAIRLDDLLEEFRNQNFSGYAEFHFSEARGILLLHSGEIITAVFKEGERVLGHERAVEAVRKTCRLEEGKISTYQLPAEMAHMLRGLCNRRPLEEVHVSGKLAVLVQGLQEKGHTGTLDLIFTQRREKGMILLIQGRISGAFLELEPNLTLEGKDALARIYQLVDEPDGTCRTYLSDFSQEIWKARRGAGGAPQSRIYQLLNDPPDRADRAWQALLDDLAGNLDGALCAALVGPDASTLASIPPAGHGMDPASLDRLLRQAAAAASAAGVGTIRECLVAAEAGNLLLCSLAGGRAHLALVLERGKRPPGLRRRLADLDRSAAALLQEASAGDGISRALKK